MNMGGCGNPFGFGDGNPFGAGGFNFDNDSFHFSTSNSRNGEIDAEELFEAFFGAGACQHQCGPQRGADLQMHVYLTFMEAVFGTTKDLNLRYQSHDWQSKQIETKERQVEVTIPAGIESGMDLCLADQGAEWDPGASCGNLLVQVIVEENDYFQQDGYDVHTDITISICAWDKEGSADEVRLSSEEGADDKLGSKEGSVEVVWLGSREGSETK